MKNNNNKKHTVKRQSYHPIDISYFIFLHWGDDDTESAVKTGQKNRLRLMKKLAVKFCHWNTSYKLTWQRMWSKRCSLVKRINKAGKPLDKCIMSPCHEISVILCIQNKNANARCDVFRQFSISISNARCNVFVNFSFLKRQSRRLYRELTSVQFFLVKNV